MTKKIDQIFRNKLGNRQAAPPPDAWSRLHSQLKTEKKNKSAIYFKAAAVILLLFCSALAFYHYQDKQSVQSGMESADALTQPGQNGLEAQKALAKLEELASENDRKEESIKDPVFSAPTTHIADLPKSTNNNKQKIQETVPMEKTPQIEILTALETLLAEAEKPTSEGSNKKEFQGVTITYIKGGVQENLATATGPVEKEDKSALKKFLKVAQEIKNTDISLAEIRDSKEDIFALKIEKL